MYKIDEEKIINTLKIIKKIKVFTVNQLGSFLDCSIPCVRLKLKQWKAYTSYNQNGKYYTLHETPIFDSNGLWFYENIYFSKYGNLKETVVKFIRTSESGLTGAQIGELLKLSPRSFLHHFQNVSGIRREKHEGVFTYFSDEQDIYLRQIKKIIITVELPTDADSIIILVEFIKHPNVPIEVLTTILVEKGVNIGYEVIFNFLEYHDLLKKNWDTKR